MYTYAVKRLMPKTDNKKQLATKPEGNEKKKDKNKEENK